VKVIIVAVPTEVCDFAWFVPTYSNIIQHYKTEKCSISYKIILSFSSFFDNWLCCHEFA